MGDIRCVYSDAKGLWWENRYRAIIESICNLLLNYILGKFFGIYGIIIATLISLFVINFLWGTRIVFKYYFTQINISEYYLSHLLYAIITAMGCYLTYWICSKIEYEGLNRLLTTMAICFILPNLFFFLCYYRIVLFNVAKTWLLNKVIK